MSSAGPAVSIARDVREGRRQAAAIVSDHLEHVASSQQRLNAFTSIAADEALRQARKVDDAVSAGRDPGPLAGVPIAVKDLIDQQGIATTNGSSFPVEPAEATATAVARLEEAGAVVIGRTGLHEYAFGFSSENHWFGPVRNPWDVATSPGGSSGGSGAAVAAGLVPLAVGTDTGGSVRVPAALCGVIGLKVTHGRIPLTGVTPLASSFDTVGPLARSVADAAVMYAAMSGHDPADPWSLPHEVATPGTPPDLTGLRFGIPEPWTSLPVTADVAAGWRHFLAMLEEAGAEVVSVPLPTFDYPGLIAEAMYPEVAAVHRKQFAAAPEKYGPEVRARIEATLDATMDGYLAGLAWRRRLRVEAENALAALDALVTPTVAAVRKVIGIDSITVQQDEVPYRQALSCFTALVNQAGLPALSMPIATEGAPPPSVQLIGARWSEHRLLEVGAALERAGVVAVPVSPKWA